MTSAMINTNGAFTRPFSSESDCVSVSTTAVSGTSELEERFQEALTLDAETQHRILEDAEGELDEVTQEELDALYARDMFALTGQERNTVLHDVHTVSDPITETPDFVQRHRELLEHELDLLLLQPRQKTFAYKQARLQNPSYICSAEFQLLFLRAERWDARASAARMTGFLETKLELFGPGLLTKRVTISDLSKDDRKSLESGFIQLLPVRDIAGRAIIVGIPMLRNYTHVQNLKRTFFYMIMASLEDEDTQKAGIVLVGYNMGPKAVVDRKAAFAVQNVKRHLPCSIRSIHYCYNDFRFRPMLTLAMLVMGPVNRVRLRAHYGSLKDVMYKLNTCGLPSPALPISDDGEPKTKNHTHWLKLRKSQELEQASGNLPSSIVVVPNRSDVLLGRGKPIQEHFGNIRYHLILDFYQDAYERSQKFQKIRIAQRILDAVNEYGGRFLKQEAAGFVPVDETVAKEKVAHAFRTRRTTDYAASASTAKNSIFCSSSRSGAVSPDPLPSMKRRKIKMLTGVSELVPSSTASGHTNKSPTPAPTATIAGDNCSVRSQSPDGGGVHSVKRIKQ